MWVGVFESDVSTTDAASGTGETDGTGRDSIAERFGIADHARSGNLAVASGVTSLVRAGRSLLRGDRKRGLAQALVGLLLVGVAVAQRRRGGGTRMSDVVRSSPDIEGAVEPGERETDHATGESVVDTKSADIDRSDIAESDATPESETGAETGDVDQRDVVETGTVDAAEDDETAEADGTDAAETEGTDSAEAGETEETELGSADDEASGNRSA